MKNVMLMIGLIFAGILAEQAQAFAEVISCLERPYDYRLITVDLKKREFVVEDPYGGIPPYKVLGKGQVGRSLLVEGLYVKYPLYENSKSVGYLKMALQGAPPQVRSTLMYQGDITNNGMIYCKKFTRKSADH